MALNDDALDDVETTTHPNLIDDDALKTLTENINTVIKENDSPVDNTLLNQIVSADVALKTLDEDYTTICEKRVIEEETISKESISRIDAELIQNIFGGLITPTVAIEQFTTIDSKTNYAYTLRYMNKNISLEQEALNINYTLFLNKTLKDVSSVLEKIQNEYIVILKDSLNYLKFTNSDIFNKLKENKNLVIPYDEGFENIAKLNLSVLDIDKVRLVIENKEVIKKAISNIKTLLEDKDLNALIKCISNSDDLNCIFKSTYGIEVLESNILTLAEIIEGSIIDKHIEAVNTTITDLLKNIEKIIEKGYKDTNNFENVNNNFEEVKSYSNEIISKSSVIVNLVLKLISFINSLETVFEFSKRF